MNARAEAQERLGDRYEARVLEPSPPAVSDPPWFADDPVARGDVPEGQMVVSPVSTGDLRWDELVADDRGLADWCAERWLAAYRRLDALPPGLIETRLAMHKLAESVISSARRKANSKIGLRYTRGGFGTPFFGADVQVRVAGTELIMQQAGRERTAPITTLAAAAEEIGPELLPDDVVLDDQPLDMHPAATEFLGDWCGFAASVLEQLRAQAPADSDPSRVQLWPEHFDIAVEIGGEAAGGRAAYGLSPGDEAHGEPYAYVAPWAAQPLGELWQASGFPGAELPYSELLEAEDQRTTVLDFMRARLEALMHSSHRG